jgi:branched-chain amino acid transport system substrate-binding protein
MRRRSLTACTVALALVAAACGGDDEAGAPAPAPAAAEEPAAEEPAAEEPAAEEPAAEEPAAEEPAAEVTAPDNPDQGVTSDEIKIGYLGDMTGPTASAQSFNAHGADAYFTCANERGGILGRQVDYIIEDDQYNTEKAVTSYTKLTQDDKVLAIHQMGGSGQSTTLAPRVIEDQIPVVGLPQTIDAQIDNPYMFNNIAHYGDQADAAWGHMVADIGAAEDVIVYGISLEVPSGQEFAAYVEATVNAGGGTYLGTSYLGLTATEATAQVQELQNAIDQGANYLTLHGSPGAALTVVNSMADAGIDLPIIGIHGVASNSIWEQGPAAQTDGMAGMHSFMTANNDIKTAETLGEVTRQGLTDTLKSQPWESGGISCPMDWTEVNHSPCAAPFTYDAASGGMVPLGPFGAYADYLDGVYGIGA